MSTFTAPTAASPTGRLPGPAATVMLNSEQLDSYRDQGYASCGQLLDEEELVGLRREIEQIIAALPPEQRPENMPSRHYDSDYLCGLFLSDGLVDVAEQILGPDIALFTSYIISKRPADGLAVAWHQDAAYFPIEPMETFTMWVAVDDSDADNGCMRVLPGSHRERRIWPHSIDLGGERTLPLQLPDLDLTAGRDVTVAAGGYSLHDPFLLHGSNPNRSSRRRCGGAAAVSIQCLETAAASCLWVS